MPRPVETMAELGIELRRAAQSLMTTEGTYVLAIIRSTCASYFDIIYHRTAMVIEL